MTKTEDLISAIVSRDALETTKIFNSLMHERVLKLIDGLRDHILESVAESVAMPTYYTDPKRLRDYATKINASIGSDIVKYYPARNAHNIPSVTGKLSGGVDGLQAIVDSAFGKGSTVEPLSGELAKKISGTYSSFSVSFPDGTGFYFRNVVGEKSSLSKKDLTPTKLKLDGKTLTKEDFVETVEVGLIESDELPMEVLMLAHELLYESSGRGTSIPLGKNVADLMKSIQSADVKTFGNNYGEILLAHWCLHNKKDAESIFFPAEENAALADFVVHFKKSSNKPPLNVSAKNNGGANASVNSIIPANATAPEGSTPAEVQAFKAIMAVTHDKIIDGLLNAQKILRTPEYQVLEKMCNGTVTIQTVSSLVERVMESCGIHKDTKWDPTGAESKAKYENFLSGLSPFFKAINWGGKPSITSIPKIVALGKGKMHHPIFYAFSVSLAERFNNNPEFANVLDKAASSIKAEQIYLSLSPTSMGVNVKQFSNSKFQFAAGAFAYAADNVRMKVKMLK